MHKLEIEGMRATVQAFDAIEKDIETLTELYKRLQNTPIDRIIFFGPGTADFAAEFHIISSISGNKGLIDTLHGAYISFLDDHILDLHRAIREMKYSGK